jgi:hypothetical protein
MIVATRENIYGIDVFTFYDSNENPFQLTFEESLNGKLIEVSLVNLIGSNDSKYCNEIRQAISGFVLKFLKERRRTVYFDIAIQDKRGVLLSIKFIRWLCVEKRIEYKIEVTKLNGIEYIEFFIKLKQKI